MLFRSAVSALTGLAVSLRRLQEVSAAPSQDPDIFGKPVQPAPLSESHIFSPKEILISSNLERLIYTIAGQDGQKNAELMDALKSSGAYEITKEMKAKLDDFVGGYATEEQTAQAIHDTYKRTGYVMDTHTAVASCVCAQYREESGDETKCLIASTASPYKFVGSVMRAIDAEYAGRDEFELVDELEKLSQVAVPNAVKEIRDAKILHTRECDADKMKETVKEILEIEV